MRTLAFGLSLALLAAPAAWAQAEQQGPTVGEMLQPCEAALERTLTGDPDLDHYAIHCDSVAYGIALVMEHNCAYAGSISPSAPGLMSGSVPSSTAAVQAWVNWARANPARWGDDFGPSLLPVMDEAFPCEN